MTTKRQLGIYSLTNTVNNMRFINSSTSVHRASSNLIKKLINNEYKNKRLQNAWNEYGKDNFTYEILEIVKYSELLNERKRHWINTYRSNEVGMGYNLELTERPWERKRREWRLKKTWDVEGSVRDVLRNILIKLDYNIEFSEDRIKHLNTVLNEGALDWLVDYISSPLYAEKQIKSSRDFLTEDDNSLILMSNIVDYLVFPKYKNQEEKMKKAELEHTMRIRKSDVRMDHRRGNEVLFGSKEEIEKDISTSPLSNPNLKESKTQKIYKVETKHKITKEDIKNYPEIKELQGVIDYLRKFFGYGESKEVREEIRSRLNKNHSAIQLRLMQNLYNNLSSEILDIKEQLVGTINFIRLQPETTVFDYHSDTGYFKGDSGEGEYVLVSENKIDFSKEKHILELINFYSSLKQRVEDNPDSDLWTIMFVLDELIEKTKFEDYMKDILIFKIDGYEVDEIIEDIEKLHGVVLSEERLSKIHNEIIPKMIVETYLQDREDWIYTYKVKGVYKTCSRCKEVKLAINKYYGADKRNRDGFDSRCRECERVRKVSYGKL